MTPPSNRSVVLLAEDNSDHAFFTSRAFREVHGDGLEMHTVTDGEQVLSYLRKEGSYAESPRPHLIVLDLRMPKKGGLEVLSEMQADASLAAIPVVVLSSSDRAEDIKTSYARGANSYVTKSMSLAGLRDGVANLARYWMDVASLPEPA
jgi:CheY-like chemotaxis protein